MTTGLTNSTTNADFSGIVAAIVAAYVSNNSLPAAELPDLIMSIYSAVAKISGDQPTQTVEPTQEPAVPIKKSVTRDAIICLEDGKKFKSLRRHLATAYGMTPDAYRAKWGLPSDYPMVAPAYSEARSKLAKDFGLGSQRGLRSAAQAAKAPEAVKAGRGRPKKAA